MLRPVLAALLLFVPASALAWGFDGHRRLASRTPDTLPANSCLRAWLKTVSGTFKWYDKACDPDRWRETDANEWPRHYLDIDYANPIESYPREWAEAQAWSPKYAVKNGTVPWTAEERYVRLVAAMKAGDSAAALDEVAYLSHYVTDAFSPMHDTKNQGSEPAGLHLRYESEMLRVDANLDAISAAMPQYFGTLGRAHPRHHVFDAVIVGNPLAQKIIADDVAAAGDASALYANTKDMTARRFADALTLMGSLIGTAWVEAGKPMLAGMPEGCSTAVAQGEVVLNGYPLPQPVDSGVPDAGETDAGPGEEGPDGGNGGWQPYDPPDGREDDRNLGLLGCGCGAGSLASVVPALLFLVALTLRRRA